MCTCNQQTCTYEHVDPICPDTKVNMPMYMCMLTYVAGIHQYNKDWLFLHVGAIIATNANESGVIGVIVCWIGLFAPGILLLYGLLPWWVKFRQFSIYRR